MMNIIRYPQDRTELPSCVAALGFFDGVHVGHRALLSMAKEAAKARRLPLAVLTFPSESPSLKSNAMRLTSTEEKCGIFASLGIDTVILCDFDAVKALSPEAFVQSVLMERFGVKTAVTGENFRFGKNAQGNAALLEKLLKPHGAELLLCPDFQQNGETVSSAAIRTLLTEGNIPKASAMLGEPFSLLGEVTHGIGLAGKEGIPTVNTDSEKLLLLRKGVYASSCEADGIPYSSVTNVGICPTVGSRPLHAETHLIGYSGNLYGKTIRITLLDFMREEMHFSSEKELFMQIELDIQARKARKD